MGERAIGDRPVVLDLVVNGAPQRCPPRVKEQLLLIGQEAVNNAVRHGQPTRVDIELHYDERQHTPRASAMTGEDSIPPALRSRRPLWASGMRERADNGGRIHIESAPGRGTQVETSVPT